MGRQSYGAAKSTTNCIFCSSAATSWRQFPNRTRVKVIVFRTFTDGNDREGGSARALKMGPATLERERRNGLRKEDRPMLTRMMNDFAPLLRLHDEMDRWVENFFEDAPAAAAAPRPYGAAYPALNSWEDADSAWVEAELPGLGLEDVEVLVNGGEVTIAGERKPAEARDGANWHRRERSHGRFSRTLTLPWDVDADKVHATLRDGVLTVQLPKADTAKPRKVEVLGA
jgi:HSP20 family protein